MAQIVKDRVRDTSTTTGTGALTVSGTAPTGHLPFSSVCATSDTVRIIVHNQAVPSEWEVSNATYSAANQLTRTTIEASSNAGAAVNFSAGTKDVVHVITATQIASAGGGTPGGSTLQLQYNNAGAFGGANLYQASADIIEQRNSTAAETFRIYNTYTNSSNYERGVFDWTTTANVLTIGTQALGTGALRSMTLVAAGESSGTLQLKLSGNGFGTNGTSVVMPNGGFFNTMEGSLFGTNDIQFQALPASSAGYGVLEAHNSAGLSIGTSGNTNPIIFKINRTEVARLTAGGLVVLGVYVARTKAGAPTTGDIPNDGEWALIRDTTNNTTKIYYNNSGSLQSVTLT